MKGVHFLRRNWVGFKAALAKLAPTRPDPIFDQFKPGQCVADGNVLVDYFGVTTSIKFRKGLKPAPAGRVTGAQPEISDQYPEWVFLLESLVASRDKRSIVIGDFGAGWGPWLTVGHAAARQLNPSCEVTLFGVEADQAHFTFLKEHLKSNGIDPSLHILTRAAVSARDGSVEFEDHEDPAGPYGQSILSGAKTSTAKPRTVVVPAVSAATALDPFPIVDYLTIDIQGAELDLIKSGIGDITKKVRFLQIATHSKEIHRQVKAQFAAAGWKNRFCFPHEDVAKTPWGFVKFADGSQSWINPRL